MRLDPADDGGAVAILVAIVAVVMFGFAAIVVDLGYARTVEGDAQSAVDAASLAGAGVLADDAGASEPFNEATAAIKNLAQQNFGTTDADWDSCTTTKPSASWVSGGSGTSCILFNHATNPTKLQVVLPTKHVDSFFGGLVGYGGIDISAQAQATIREDDVPGCALCVRGFLDTSGPVVLSAANPDDPVGSSAADDGQVQTGGSISVQDPGAITFANTPSPAGGPSYSTRPIIRPVVDPFAGDTMPAGGPGNPVPFPPAAPTNNVVCGPDLGGVASLDAGVYGNITVTGDCTASGVIVVTGRFRGLRVRSGGNLTGPATVQLSCGSRTSPVPCSSAGAGGRLRIDAGGQVDLSSAFSSQFSVVADPNNTSSMAINGDLSVGQGLYGWSTSVTVGSGATLTTFGRVSVGRLTVLSGAAVSVQAAGGEPVPGPPMVGLYR